MTWTAAWAAIELIAVVAAAQIDAAGARQGTGAVTFTRDMAPILYRNCTICHHAASGAAFSLLTYADVRPRARQIAAVTAARSMPPWKPDQTREFVGARQLTDAEIDTIGRWAAQGASNGDPRDLPVPPAYSSGWRLGTPDVVVKMTEPFELRPDGSDVFRIFVLPIPTRSIRYVKAIEFDPGTRAVHHANMRIDETPTSRRLDQQDPLPGYDGLIAATAKFPEGYFFGWTPGQMPPMAPELAWRLNPGSDMVVQLHMRPTGRAERVQVAIGLYFADGPPSRTPAMLRLGKQDIDIPPNAERYCVTDSYLLPVDVEVRAIQPHAHYRATSVESSAILPDGSTRTLISIRDWDFDWQDTYRFADPPALPKGTRLTMRFTYDNSEANRRNPERPPVRVHWGQNSTDEMGDVWIQVVARSSADHDRLTREFRDKVFREDIVGYETVLRTRPDNAALHDDVALLYLAVGRTADAVAHFARSAQLKPSVATAHFNLGTALAAAGRRADAVAEYREAMRLDDGYAPAHNNLGSLLLADARLDAARRQFDRALALNPGYAEAHNNLGKLLAIAGRNREAADHLRRALDLAPAYSEAHYNLAHLLAMTDRPAEAIPHFRAAIDSREGWVVPLVELAWILATDRDQTVRNPAEAVEYAGRAVALMQGRSAAALDALGAAYAARGDFDRALTSARAALELDGGSADGAAIATRAAGYEHHRAFVDRTRAGPLPIK